MRKLIEALMPAERELVIKVMANVDSIKAELTPEQQKILGRTFSAIYGACQNLLDGVPTGDTNV